MDANWQDWADLEHLSGRITELHGRYRAAIGIGAMKAIKREIDEREGQRQRLVNRLSKHLADRVAA